MKTKNIIGIDVSKDKLSLFNDYDDSFEEISNSNESLLDYITKHNLEKNSHKIGLESTGDYGYLPMKFFANQGFETFVINPIITKKYIRSSVRGKKTDENDAKIVARMVKDNEGLVVDKNALDTSKKTLLRTENKLTMLCSDLKRIKKSLEINDRTAELFPHYAPLRIGAVFRNFVLKYLENLRFSNFPLADTQQQSCWELSIKTKEWNQHLGRYE